jgi:tRNA pseudouridine38-40 synthase
MPCYKLTVEYDGSRFNGFQRQTATVSQKRPPKQARFNENGRKQSIPLTIQDCLENALLEWTGSQSIQELRLRAAGRTDKGVHALGQVVAIDVPFLLEKQDEWELCRATNSRLPDDVSVKSFQQCHDSFDPRHNAILKQYTYTMRYRRKVIDDAMDQVLPICLGGIHSLRSAHDSPCLYKCPWPLDYSNLVESCHKLAGVHDYSCFVHKEERRKRDNVMEITKFDVEFLQISKEDGPAVTVKFTIEARGFRRTMVRNLVGFVVDVCRGKVEACQVDSVWTGTDEAAAMVHAAPACGLCLTKVVYPPIT